MTSQTSKTFVVEHLDPELEAWSSLEYSAIASECHAAGARFLLSSVPESLQLPERLQQAKGLSVERRSVEEIYAAQKDRVCLLDPAASKDLSPEDGDAFDVFLFGGILGEVPINSNSSPPVLIALQVTIRPEVCATL
jgi:ribosome biogenesis SPOUT family RNA methylase Rps3